MAGRKTGWGTVRTPAAGTFGGRERQFRRPLTDKRR